MSLQELSLKAVPHLGEQARKFCGHGILYVLHWKKGNSMKGLTGSERNTNFVFGTYSLNACVRRLKLDPALVSQPRVMATEKLTKGVDCSLFR